MANIGKWNAPGAVVTAFSTALNSMANNTSVLPNSATITNGSNLDVYMDLELVIAAQTTLAGAFCAIYIAEAIDGSNFPAQSAADMRLSNTQLFTVIPVGGLTGSATRTVVRNVVMPPGSFQLVFDNQTGTTLAASGNTLRYIAYDLNLKG